MIVYTLFWSSQQKWIYDPFLLDIPPNKFNRVSKAV
jgi:hypothetical protein